MEKSKHIEIVWKLTSKSEDANYRELIEAIINNDPVDLTEWEIGQVDKVVISFRDEFINYITEKGLGTLLNLMPIQEEIVRKGETRNNIILTLHRFLNQIKVDKELIIIDPYFYAHTKDVQYADTIEQVIQAYVNNLDNLHIITLGGKKVDSNLKGDVEQRLKRLKPSLNITHHTTSEFHDRFWISNSRQSGIVTGTSLNGLGRRYALIDKLDSDDVKEIVDILKNRGFI